MGFESISFAFGQGTNTSDQSGSNESDAANSLPENSEEIATSSIQPEPTVIHLDHAPTAGVDIRL